MPGSNDWVVLREPESIPVRPRNGEWAAHVVACSRLAAKLTRMTGRELGTSLLIGVLSGVVVTVVASTVSGGPVTGFLEAAPVEHASPSPFGHAASAPPTAGPSPVVTAVPSARPTVVQATEPATVPSVAPSGEPIAALTFDDSGVKAGLPAQNGRYGAATPVVAAGRYISWRAVVGPDGSGQVVDVEVATRLDGAWTGWSKLTTRLAGADGAVVFSWRQQTPVWISIRFALPTDRSTALQGRWR